MSGELAGYNAQMQEVAERFADKFVTAIGDAIQSHEEAMRKAIEDAVRWEYYHDELCSLWAVSGNCDYGSRDHIVCQLELCIPSEADHERLMAEGKLWARLAHQDAIHMTNYDLTTWEQAQALLAEKEGQGDD